MASPATPASRLWRSPVEGRQERSALATGALSPPTAQLPAVRGGAAPGSRQCSSMGSRLRPGAAPPMRAGAVHDRAPPCLPPPGQARSGGAERDLAGS
eukprot:1949422-Alexandrium_andersonii.AAC.1